MYIDPKEALKHLANEGIQVDTRAQMAGNPHTVQGTYAAHTGKQPQ
jgi:hypothetical protein